MFTVALACDGSTFGALPPATIVGATVVRAIAAASCPANPNSLAVSHGAAAAARYACA
jgi:hypothetical protein